MCAMGAQLLRCHIISCLTIYGGNMRARRSDIACASKRQVVILRAADGELKCFDEHANVQKNRRARIGRWTLRLRLKWVEAERVSDYQ